MQTVLITLLIATCGALAAWFLGLPVPFLTGPAALVSLAALLGVRCRIPIALRDVAFLIIGIVLGSSVTVEILSAAGSWPTSLVAMCVNVAIVMLAGGWMFRRVFAMDRNTALLASSPGHLSFVLSLSTEMNADTAIVSVIQSMRVLILTLLVPVVVALTSDADMTTMIQGEPVLSAQHLGILVGLSVGLGLALKKARVPAAYLISGMICSTIGHGAGLTPNLVPQSLATAAFVVMGALIGTRFSGVTLAMLRRAAIGGVTLTLLGLAISVSAATILSYATGLRLIDVIIAFAPGGLETMVAMGAVLGADPAFVVIHHVARLFFLSAFVPVVLSRKIGDRLF